RQYGGLRSLEPDPLSRRNRRRRGEPLGRADRDGCGRVDGFRDRDHTAPVDLLSAPPLGLCVAALARPQGLPLRCRPARGFWGGGIDDLGGTLASNATTDGGLRQRLHKFLVPVPKPGLPIDPALLRHERERAAAVQNRIADRITAFSGSMAFVYIHIIWFGCW